MLATLLIWLSAAVAILAIVDLFLSASQKTWLSNAVIKTWNILDEAKGWSFADWIKESRATWWLAVGLGLLLGLLSALSSWLNKDIWEATRTSDDNWIWVVALTSALICFIFFIFAFLTRRIFAWLLKSGSVLRIAKTTAVTCVLCFLTWVLIGAIAGLSDFSLPPWLDVAIHILLLLTLPLVLLVYCGLTIFVARGLAYLASAIFYVGEFTVRRIAEYPKGPVLALSALFGGIVALIKAFG
jgi:hypothetical protein